MVYRVILGMSADKDIQSCLQYVKSIVNHDLSRIYCTEVKFSLELISLLPIKVAFSSPSFSYIIYIIYISMV
jgi:hypothetical protein